jgi:hypothetical protein
VSLYTISLFFVGTVISHYHGDSQYKAYLQLLRNLFTNVIVLRESLNDNVIIATDNDDMCSWLPGRDSDTNSSVTCQSRLCSHPRSIKDKLIEYSRKRGYPEYYFEEKYFAISCDE